MNTANSTDTALPVINIITNYHNELVNDAVHLARRMNQAMRTVAVTGITAPLFDQLKYNFALLEDLLDQYEETINANEQIGDVLDDIRILLLEVEGASVQNASAQNKSVKNASVTEVSFSETRYAEPGKVLIGNQNAA